MPLSSQHSHGRDNDSSRWRGPRFWLMVALMAFGLLVIAGGWYPVKDWLVLPTSTAAVTCAAIGLLIVVTGPVFLWPSPQQPGRATGAGQGRMPLKRLILIGWTVGLWLVVVLLLAAWLVLDLPQFKPPDDLAPRDLESITVRAFAVIAGLGGVAYLVTAYRRQRTTEEEADRDVSRLFTERYASASAQFGETDNAVRLAGVHALAHAADQAPTTSERQMVVNVLCSYLRTLSQEVLLPVAGGADEQQRNAYRQNKLAFEASREVRRTIIDVIASRLRTDPRWQNDLRYDFDRVVIDGANFTGIQVLKGISFRGARFRPGRAQNVDFDRAHLHGADFTGAHFESEPAPNTEISFDGATLENSSFKGAWFRGAPVRIRDQATLTSTDFTGVHLQGGSIEIHDSTLNGTTSFRRARFTGSTPVVLLRCDIKGTVDLHESWFTDDEAGGIYFNQGTLTGMVSFQRALLNQGVVQFEDITLDGGEISFAHATLDHPLLNFRLPRTERAQKGMVDFSEVKFPNSENASELRPHGLLQAETDAVVEVRWPPQWKPATDTPKEDDLS